MCRSSAVARMDSALFLFSRRLGGFFGFAHRPDARG